MKPFAAIADVSVLTGREFTSDEVTRVAALLPLVSDALRQEAVKVGKDMDEMIAASESYANVAKLVTVDVVARALRQSSTGEPLSQESQTALGYTWSGTYAIPGGGIANAIMRNDLKRLGLRRQRYGVMELWGNHTE